MGEQAIVTRRSRAGLLSAADVVDVFVYVTVLNLAIQYLPAVIAETFTMSLLTAVLLKLVLEIVIKIKSRVKVRFRQAGNLAAKIGAGLLFWAVLVGSKLVVLELIALVFRGYVDLGGFLPVTLLIVVLLLSRSGVRRLLALDDPPTTSMPA